MITFSSGFHIVDVEMKCNEKENGGASPTFCHLFIYLFFLFLFYQLLPKCYLLFIQVYINITKVSCMHIYLLSNFKASNPQKSRI